VGVNHIKTTSQIWSTRQREEGLKIDRKIPEVFIAVLQHNVKLKVK
jgi:hypothetical protein